MVNRHICLMLISVLCIKSVTCAAVSGYTDVPETAWYADAVEYVTDQGIMQETGNDRDRFEAVRLFHDPEQLLLGFFLKTRSSCFRLSTYDGLRLSTSRYKGI